MSTDFPNYYEILGVPKDATQEQIKKRYRQLARKYPINRLMGLANKYRDSGDEDLLEMIEEKIRLAQDAMKEINEAYEVLADPSKRAKYDQRFENVHIPTPPPTPPPEAIISPVKVDFGTVEQGKSRTRSFTIENRGGLAASIDINWEHDHEWGKDLIIEPDPNKVFPIKVRVSIDTSKTFVGHKSGRILVIVDDQIHSVDVTLEVVETQPMGAPKPTPPPPSGKRTARVATVSSTPRSRRIVLAGGLLVVAATICVAVSVSFAFAEKSKERQVEESINQVVNKTVSSIKVVSIESKLLMVDSLLGELWDFAVEIQNAGELPVKIQSISDHRTGYDSSRGCYANEEAVNSSQLWYSADNPDQPGLWWISSFDVYGETKDEILQSGATATFICKLEAPFPDIFSEGINLRIIVYKADQGSFSGYKELGRGWLEVEQFRNISTSDVRATEAAKVEEAQRLIIIENAELTPVRVINSDCNPSECQEVDAITYTIVNGWVNTVKLHPGYYYLAPGQYLNERWFPEELGPGQRMTFYQWLIDAETCIDVSVNGTGYEWKICPLDYINR